jgi:pyruvate,water dikinase
MSLARLLQAGMPVPGGFHITTAAYRAFVAANDLQPRILKVLAGLDAANPAALETASQQIRALFTAAPIPPEIADAIIAAYHVLNQQSAFNNHKSVAGEPFFGSLERPAKPVAVRSSATAEDLPDLSFAGQQETYLNVIGASALLEAVVACWSSLWTARAIGYRARNRIAPDDVALAVVVQQLIASEISGVAFTANPLTGQRGEIVIEASFGLGEAIVSGQVEPDHFVVNVSTWQITARDLGEKAIAILPRAEGGTQTIEQARANTPSLPDEQIIALAKLSKRVADHYDAPQDIEWAWANRQFYLLQARRITTLP